MTQMALMETQVAPTIRHRDSPSHNAEELVLTIRELLDQQDLLGARRTAAQAAEAHPDHPWLTRANRVLNPGGMTTRPAEGHGRSGEFAWLRRNSAAYRGRWVALLEDQLIASGETLAEVLDAVAGRHLDAKPLVHFIE